MVLDRDFDAGIHQPSAHVLQHLDGVVDVRIDAVSAVGALPSTARTIGERTIFAASIIRPSCSSAVPCALSNIVDVGQMERMPISSRCFSSSARARTLAQVVGLERSEEADLAEVHDLHVPLGGEIELLERRPVLLR